DPDPSQVHVVNEGLQHVNGNRNGSGIKRIGFDDVGARFKVLAVDRLDELGPGDTEEIVASLQVRGVVDELAPAKARLIQPLGLNHGAHRAVQDGDPSL